MTDDKNQDKRQDHREDYATKSVTYVYGIYDMKKLQWMPGTYKAEEVRREFGFKGSVSELAKLGVLLKKRYKVVIVEEVKSEKEKFAEEWDADRMRLLRKKKR